MPPWSLVAWGLKRPELVSEINVAQPGLSQGSATVVRMRQLLGYARVSTADQQPHLQGRRPPASRLVPGVHRDRQRRPHRPSDAQRALLDGSLHRPLDPAAHQLLDLAARQALGRICPMMGCLGRCRRPGSLLEARWSLATVCLRRHFGVARLRRLAAGRTPAWSRSPSSPKCCACVVIERCPATAKATGDAELAAARGCERC
jgi:hypothetical protein